MVKTMVSYIMLILSTILICASCAANNLNTKCVNKKNVLLIIIDDLRPLLDENIVLSNINKLAGRGINFKQAFAQQSLCAPSRNSMLTGRRPDSLHLYDFYSYWRDTVGNFTSIPQFFKENGYNTYSIGKIFHPGKSSNFTDDYPLSWSVAPYHPPTESFKNSAVCKDKITRNYQRNLICPINVKKQPGKSLPDLQSLEYAISILKKQKLEDKPLFMAVGFHKPHIPLKFPEEYLGCILLRHLLEKVPLSNVKSPNVPFMPADMPVVSWHPWTDIRHRDDIHRLNISFPFGTIPYKWTRKIKQSYMAATLYIDDLLGILMRYVDTNNTIVVLTSDHGWSLGENGLWAKYSNFDVALKVPLIISAPQLQHREVDIPVELIDIFPTLVDMTFGKVIPKCKNRNHNITLCVEGKSLVPFFENNISNSVTEDHLALSQYPRPSIYPQKNTDKPQLKDIKIMGYSIRTQRLRYTEWISFNSTLFRRDWNTVYGIELYDHSFDEYESRNLYEEPKYQHVKQYLSHILRSKVEYLSS